VKVSIVIPLYNQLTYTKTCLESLRRTTPPEVECILIDNASSDGTGEYLAQLTDVRVIANADNRGCAGAWNQGVTAASGEWVIILNNDVILSAGWIEGLLAAAARWGLDIVTPAIREGEYNYDIDSYAPELTGRMNAVVRRGRANGVCFMVHRRVFEKIGVFDENFRIGQYEDKDFFLRAAKAGFRLGTVGCSFLHHYGSVTQNSMKTARVFKPYAVENKAYFTRKWKLSWWDRALSRNSDRMASRYYSLRERVLYGYTLMEKWIDGKLRHE
jgi:N-acetylglucosaminyl-diphospho-decaprenol L-rhamnosyltransferase